MLDIPSQTEVKLAEADKSLLSIRQARDRLLARAQELSAKLASAEERIAELEDEHDFAVTAREAAEKREAESRLGASALQRELDELYRQQGLRPEEAADGDKLAVLMAQIADLTAERDRLSRELELERQTTVANESRLAELLEAKSKLPAIEEQSKRAEAALKTTVAKLESQLAAAQRARNAAVANVIKVQAQVDSLKKEAETLKKETETARQQSREEQTILEAQIMALRMTAESLAAESAAAIHEWPPQETALPAPPPKAVKPVVKAVPKEAKRFLAGGASAAIGSLSATLGQLVSDPSQTDWLEKLDADLHEFAERAQAEELPALSREAQACGEVTRWLRKMPARIATTAPALADAIALLKELASLKLGSREIEDPAGSLVFAVDDDVDNCECIAMTFEKLDFQTRYCVRPETALAQLEKESLDLIVLDVDLPGMDGFQLHERLRRVPHHRDTPIIFLSGLISTRDRLQELPPGNQTFLAKPYNLTALSLQALTMILRSRLAGVVVL